MTRKLIYEIALELQNRFVSIALSEGKVNLIDAGLPPEKKFTWNNCEPALGLLDSRQSIDPDKLAEFRKLFPIGRRSSKVEEEERARMFLAKHSQYTFDDVLRAARKYTQETDPQYIVTSGYFFSKRVTGQAEVSKLLNYLEAESEEDNSIDYEHI